jgi:hypothetical protein
MRLLLEMARIQICLVLIFTSLFINAQVKSWNQFKKSDNIIVNGVSTKSKKICYILYKHNSRDIQILENTLDALFVQGLLDTSFEFQLCELLISENEVCAVDRQIVLGKTRLNSDLSVQNYLILVDIGDKSELRSFQQIFRQRTGLSPDILKSFDDRDGKKSSLIRFDDYRHLLKMIYLEKENSKNEIALDAMNTLKLEIDSLKDLISSFDKHNIVNSIQLHQHLTIPKSYEIFNHYKEKIQVKGLAEAGFGFQFLRNKSGQFKYSYGIGIEYGTRNFQIQQNDNAQLSNYFKQFDKDGEEFTRFNTLNDLREVHSQKYLQPSILGIIGKDFKSNVGLFDIGISGRIGVRNTFYTQNSIKDGRVSSVGYYPNYSDKPVISSDYGFYENSPIQNSRKKNDLYGFAIVGAIQSRVSYNPLKLSTLGFNLSIGSQWLNNFGKEENTSDFVESITKGNTVLSSGFKFDPQNWCIGLGINYYVK